MMNSIEKYQHLKFIDSQKLNNWSVKYLLEDTFAYNEKYPLVSIKKILKRNKIQINIQDDFNYKRVTIKINNGGIFLRDIEIGKNIGTKKQFIINKGQFLLSKIDARNGAFGVVPEEVDNGIITGNFWTYDVDYSMVNPHYLSLITNTSQFINFCKRSSAGTTNRHYLQENLFLNEKIPLPSIEEQEELIQDYQNKIQLAEKLGKEANNLEQDIEKYLLEELELTFRTVQKVETGKLYFVDFLNLQNWVYSSDELTFYEDLHKSKYKVDEIGNIFSFITRTWNKKKEENKEYIEIGAIDPNFGILETKTINSKKAPSRATQLVKKGDLIIGTTRPYLKKFTIIDEIHDGFVASSGFSVVEENKEKYNLYYLNEVLKSNIGIKQFEIKMTGALYPAITQSDLSSLKIPVPSLDIQNKIASNIEQMKQNQKNKTQQAEILRKEAISNFEKAIFN